MYVHVYTMWSGFQMTVVAVADIGHPDIGPDINTDIGYSSLVYDISEK